VSVDTRPAGSAGSVGDRYRLLECVAGDPDGPAVAWRAWDDVLNRPVTLTVVRPGGEPASGFLAHAHAVSGVTHPSLARVWDAVDEGDRAYVVSEWVTGTPFTALLRDGALDADSAAGTVARVADGVAAAHRAGVAFGGVHPDHVVVTGNGEVKLAQVVGDGRAAAADDVRGLGALLYGALTAHWPLAPTGGAATLRPATTSSGHLLSPRQVRAGVPEDLSSLAVRALDQTSPNGLRSAAAMAGVLADRSASSDDVFALGAAPGRRRRPRWLTLILPVGAGLVVLALLGWLVGAALGGLPGNGGGGATAGTGGPSGSTTAAVAAPPRVVKPVGDALFDPRGDRTEDEGIDASTDGNPATAWQTDLYKRNSSFGGLKPGIGIVYDLGSAVALKQVTVATDNPGIRVEIRAGNTPGATTDVDGYKTVSAAQTMKDSGTFAIKAGTSARYYVVWLTQLTGDGDGFRGSVSEVTFKA